MRPGAHVSPQPFHFDFDAWCSLAESDPEAFFRARARLIEEFIASVPEIHRDALRELQSLIDGTRIEAGTPFKAVQKLMGMLEDHLYAMQAQVELLRAESERMSAHLARLRS